MVTSTTGASVKMATPIEDNELRGPGDVEARCRMQQPLERAAIGGPEEGMSRGNAQLERVRARSSYVLFQQLYDFLNGAPAISAILRKFYDILDAKGAFGSVRNAGYAAESLALLLHDMTEASRASRE